VQHLLRRAVQALDLGVVEPLRERDRREPRAVQDLVGVGIADAREQVRVAERA